MDCPFDDEFALYTTHNRAWYINERPLDRTSEAVLAAVEKKARLTKALSLRAIAHKIPAVHASLVRTLVDFIGLGCVSFASVGCASGASVRFVSIVGAFVIALHGALRVRSGSRASRRWVTDTRPFRLLDQDTVSTTVGSNNGHHTTSSTWTTLAFGTRRELRGELRTVDLGNLGDMCEY
jgi:hypothetical protein